MDEVPDDKEYYYTTYIGEGVSGCIIIPQFKHASGDENPDGFNIASATQYISHTMGRPIIIMSYFRTTRKRKEEFETFIRSVTKEPEPKRPSHLSIVRALIDAGPTPDVS